MTLDFTLDKYRELCEATANSKYALQTMKEYLTLRASPGKLIIIRHDVDRKPEKAVKMAEIEREFGIGATYYFRFKKRVFQSHLIKAIASMGHEIGYHYETMDKAKGDCKKAIQMFKYELEEFRKVTEVKTICMHGNPFTPWLNRDLWNHYDFRDFGIIGEGYLSVQADKILYLTDTGRTWSGNHNVKDYLGESPGAQISSTSDLINMIRAAAIDRMYIVAHPNRWSQYFLDWLREYAFDTTINVAKTLSGSFRGRRRETQGLQ